jgi:hypothetical protein
MTHDAHGGVRERPERAPEVVHGRERARVAGDDEHEVVVAHPRGAPRREVLDGAKARRSRLLLLAASRRGGLRRRVSPEIRGDATGRALSGAAVRVRARGFASRLARSHRDEEIVAGDDAVVVQVEKPEGEADARERAGQDERGEADDEPAEVHRAVAHAVEDVHQARREVVLAEAEHARELARVRLAGDPVHVRALEQTVQPGEASLSQDVHGRELANAELRLSRPRGVGADAGGGGTARPHRSCGDAPGDVS